MQGSTVFDFIYTLVTGYIFPVEANFPYYGYFLVGFCFLVTAVIFWYCFIRPFYLFIKYGMFGGSKKSKMTKRSRQDDWND